MKNKLSITSYIKSIEDVFNPEVTYEGQIVFNSKVLSLVGKKDGKKNLVDEYLEKKLFSQIRSILKNLSFIAQPRIFMINDLDNEYGRSLKPSLELFAFEMCLNLVGERYELTPGEKFTREGIVQFLRNVRKQMNEIQNGNITLENKNLMDRLRVNYEVNEKHRKTMYGVAYRQLSFKEFLDVNKEHVTTFIVGLRSLFPLFDKKINLQELEECLELDKFYLAMAKQVIETTKLSLINKGMVQNSFIYLEKYVAIIKEMRSQGVYDLTVDTMSIDGKIIKYSVDDAIREYNEIKIAHPEFCVCTVKGHEGIDYRDIKNVKEMSVEINEAMQSKHLVASWNFIEKGQKDPNEVEHVVVERLEKSTTTKASREQRVQDITDRMRFLEATDYVYKITGKNNFEGYVGYIYANGVVLFERFYEDIHTHEPAYSKATYVMNFRNFVEMSKRTKTDIMTYIKNGGTDVRRLYHTQKWCDKVSQIVAGKTYDQEAMDKIDRLLKDGKIIKRLS